MRYFTETGDSPKIEAAFFLSGPQDESQIPEGVKALLANENAKEVSVTYDYGCGPKITIFRRMEGS